ncbi:hypothetical protein DM02DRAFT_652873 [Periconia macrospinosa]|uniref:Uncharacterized protein n=1 Tax=Periconia macrospinosa TaxID=97972 RepID=A0A2V1DYV3_9PLEO|nr:hypothetical protein DM02DRAFT_652873 [Periconia macrospinosa]
MLKDRPSSLHSPYTNHLRIQRVLENAKVEITTSTTLYEYTQLSIQPGGPSGMFSIRLLRFLSSTGHNADIYCHKIGKVDYASSTEEVLTNFAILMIKLFYSIPTRNTAYNSVPHVLQLAAAFKQYTPRGDFHPSDQIFGKIPSWVPNWTRSLSYEPLHHSPKSQNASAGIPVHHIQILPLQNNNYLLLATALIYDTVTASIQIDISALLGPVYGAKNALNGFLLSVAKSIDETGFPCGKANNSYSPTGRHIFLALAPKIVATWDYTPPNSYFDQEQRLQDDFLERSALSKHILPEIVHKWPVYVKLVAIIMRGHRLFFFNHDTLGLVAPTFGQVT